MPNIFRKTNIAKIALGVSFAFFNCAESKALVTHTLDYNTVAGSSGTLSGSITINEDNVSYGAAVGNGSGDLPDWITSLTLEWDNGDGGAVDATFTKSDFMLVRWVKKSGVTPNYGTDLVPQFDNISFVGKTGTDEPSSGSAFEMNYLTNEYLLASTPGPVPFAGLSVFIAYSRKLKRLLKQSLTNY